MRESRVGLTQSDRMNLPKQSRPVIRDVSRDPIWARVRAAQPPSNISICLQWCRVMCPRNYAGCEMSCHGGHGPIC
jgi:hypothetical protein